MFQFPNTRPTGAMGIIVPKPAARPVLRVKVWRPMPVLMTVAVMLLDQHSWEPGEVWEGTTGSVPLPLTLRVDRRATDAEAVAKRNIIGSPMVYCGEGEIELPPAFRGAAVLAFRARTTALLDPLRCPGERCQSIGDAAEFPSEEFHCEVSRRQWTAPARNGSILFWFRTKARTDARFMEIAEDQGLLDRDDDATQETLCKLVYVIYSGLDSPVLTEVLNRDYEGGRQHA